MIHNVGPRSPSTSLFVKIAMFSTELHTYGLLLVPGANFDPKFEIMDHFEQIQPSGSSWVIVLHLAFFCCRYGEGKIIQNKAVLANFAC